MNKKGLGLVFLTAVVSGFAIFINKFGVKGINSSVFTLSKNIVVALLLFSIILMFSNFKEFKTLTKKQWLKLAVIGFFGGSIPFLLFFRGLQLTSSANAAFIHKTMFVYIAILALFFLKEKINKNIIVAAVLLLAGNFLLIRPGFGLSIGNLFVFTATLFWATEQIISKHTLKELSFRMVAFGRMFFGSLFIIAFLAATNQLRFIIGLTFPQLRWVLVSSVFLFAYVVTWYAGIKLIKISTAACILLFGSVITTALSFATSHVININQIIGMVLLIAGITTAIGFSHIIDIIKIPWKHHGRA